MRGIPTTVLPIFAVIAAGWTARRNALVSAEFLESANRLVFYLAIPAMVFRSISGASISGQLNLKHFAMWFGIRYNQSFGRSFPNNSIGDRH